MASFIDKSVTANEVETKEWLSAHFKKPVADLTIVDMSGTGGQSGAIMKKLVLKFEDDSDLSVILKSTAEAGQPFAKSLGLSRECFFYDMLGPTLSNVRLPEVYFAYGSMETGEKVILLENLSECIQSGYFFGPWSCINWGKDLKALCASAPEGLGPEDMARKSFLMAANMHAKYWNDPSLLTHGWLRMARYARGEDRAVWEGAHKVATDAWAKVREPTNSAKFKWDEYLVSVVESSFSKICWEEAECVQKKYPFTLVHGDFHPANMMYHPAEDSVVLLDWENVGIGSGPQDLAQYMISHTHKDVRKTIETVLLREYYEALTTAPGSKASAADFSFEVCEREFIFGGVERWIWLLAVIMNMGMPDVAKQFFHDIVSAFVQDYKDIITPESIGMPRL
jgi:hypothetical protein